jgi:hypothetical protein
MCTLVGIIGEETTTADIEPEIRSLETRKNRLIRKIKDKNVPTTKKQLHLLQLEDVKSELSDLQEQLLLIKTTAYF